MCGSPDALTRITKLYRDGEPGLNFNAEERGPARAKIDEELRMPVLCAGPEANADATAFSTASSHALASAPARRTTARMRCPSQGHPKLLIDLCTQTKAVQSVLPRPSAFFSVSTPTFEGLSVA